MAKSQLDPAQIIKQAYNEAAQAISVTLATAEIELSAQDGDSVYAATGAEPRATWDYVGYVYTNAGATVTETYRTGGAAGTIVGTVVRVYQDATRAQINSITRT